MTFYEQQPSHGKGPFMEDDLRWKTAVNRRQTLMEHNFWWKIPFNGRQSSMVDELQHKTPMEGENRASELEVF